MLQLLQHPRAPALQQGKAQQGEADDHNWSTAPARRNQRNALQQQGLSTSKKQINTITKKKKKTMYGESSMET